MRNLKINKSPLKESTALETIPDDIISVVTAHRTSLGNNPAIPDIDEKPFLVGITDKSFKEAKSQAERFLHGPEDPHELYRKAFQLCTELERPIRNQLERLCVNHVIKMFEVPEDTVDIEAILSDKIVLDTNIMKLDPIDGDEDIQFDSLKDAVSLKGEVYKRRVLDALCMGGAMELSTEYMDRALSEKIKSMYPELYSCYPPIISLNRYFLFEKEDLGMTDDENLQIGTVEVRIGNKDDKTRIIAQGKIFPVLFTEMIHGFLELFVSHGLPKDKDLALAVIGKSDFLKAEPWDMRMGPALWKLFSASFNDINSKELPYLLKRISSLDIHKFNYLMKEVFAKTKKGREIMSYLSAKAKRDMQYARFVDRMDTKKDGLGIIADDYICQEDLDHAE